MTALDSRVALAEKDRAAACPRCGYDQRGVVATWKDAQTCPLTGTCTECGLAFQWCEVVVPEKFEPRWCIEFEQRLLRLPWAAFKTLVRSFWPWGFWSRLKMSHRIRWLRLAAYPLIITLPLLLIYIGVQGGLALYVRSQVAAGLLQQAQLRPATILNLQTMSRQTATQLPSGVSEYDQQLKAQITYFNGEIARLQAAGTTPDVIDSTWLETTWEAVSQPLAQSSSAAIVSSSGMPVGPYVAPIYLVSLARVSRPLAQNWVETLALPMAWLAWGAAMTMLMPLSFVLMPFSLRKAKVRWGHVVRVTVYSVIIPLACVLAAVIATTLALVSSKQGAMEMQASIVRYAPWLAVALWWQAATSRYLKIPHAWFTIGALTLMNLLVLLAVTAAISQELAWDMMNLFGPLVR